jgi:hypothetical protein
MLKRLLMSVLLSVGAALPLAAEEVRFQGVFDSLRDCPGTGLGTACGNPPLIPVNVPFTFTMDVNEVAGHFPVVTTNWKAPQWPLPPPVTQAKFEGLVDRTYTEVTILNPIEDPAHHLLIWNGGQVHMWQGKDASGTSHFFMEQIGIELIGPRQNVGSPITFQDIVALFVSHRTTGREVNILYSRASFTGTLPDGSFGEGSRELTGHFRMCPAPSGARGAMSAIASRFRGG